MLMIHLCPCHFHFLLFWKNSSDYIVSPIVQYESLKYKGSLKKTTVAQSA